ncbi:Protoheme IX farnesyltransferase, mitochondrial [Stylosanthes scabra]|uniref:Heme O synthase n=1 Tax=Stylosanthes scabra TaxID=79078 RepID=A0ABU6V856_9FABA|nr:Protoheme IX farnesyltransferase, mitochondrial [Stylosanthes scabra]
MRMKLRKDFFTFYSNSKSKLINHNTNHNYLTHHYRHLHSSAADLSPPATKTATDLVSLTRHYATCYWQLSKARLSMLVVATSGTGFVLGSTSAVDLSALSWTCMGTMMVAASANSLNQVFEVKNDAKMKRTFRRPLPSGRITIPHAVGWASSVGLGGTALLATQVFPG